ncbi:MAG TPA: hypothetical protein VL371_26070 [Gemmataceae bacterium]|jgi:hypothetical protein|nr:hypothetical protein [Gemmataceae bacterium]
MNAESTVLVCSLALTGLLSAAVVLYLGRPLRGVLRDLCGSDERARYWVAFANVMHILLPVTAVLIAREAPRSGGSTVMAVLDQTRWALAGLILSVVSVALGVAVFLAPRSATVVVDRDQADDLQRLLSKVHALRAHEVLTPPSRGERSA